MDGSALTAVTTNDLLERKASLGPWLGTRLRLGRTLLWHEHDSYSGGHDDAGCGSDHDHQDWDDRDSWDNDDDSDYDSGVTPWHMQDSWLV